MVIARYFRGRGVPLIVATALLMENLDASVLATSLPAIARDLSVDPINLKLALTSYLLALAIFIPASGWAADRFGARLVFRSAICVFAAGSLACAMSSTLTTLVLSRVLQGIGGAMMVPVGRLIVLRSIPKAGMVAAMSWLTVPALLGPVMGPPLGGFITTYFDWRWIFWINMPIAVIGMLLSYRFIPDVREDEIRRFDALGFVLLGPGLGASLTGVTLAGLGLAPVWAVWGTIVGGVALLAAYTAHALRNADPLVDLRLLKLPTFRVAIGSGNLFRVGSGATPFLLPLMLQLGFGLSPFQSGMLTFASGAGAMTLKFIAQPILRLFGFRRVLTVNAVIAAGFIFAPALFTPQTPWIVMVLVLFVGGICRSLEFTAIQTIVYDEVPKDRLSSATSFSSVTQQLTKSVGITVAALGLEMMQRVTGTSHIELGHFPYVFGLIALLPIISAISFFRMPKGAGDEMLERPAKAVPVPHRAPGE